jgi:hypothetical protein
VFSLFEQLGTVHAVLRFLVEHQVQIRVRERSGPGPRIKSARCETVSAGRLLVTGLRMRVAG